MKAPSMLDHIYHFYRPFNMLVAAMKRLWNHWRCFCKDPTCFSSVQQNDQRPGLQSCTKLHELVLHFFGIMSQIHIKNRHELDMMRRNIHTSHVKWASSQSQDSFLSRRMTVAGRRAFAAIFTQALRRTGGGPPVPVLAEQLLPKVRG